MKKLISLLILLTLIFTSLLAMWHPRDYYFRDPVEFKYQKSIYHETVQEATYHLQEGETKNEAYDKVVRMLIGKTLIDRGVEVSGSVTTYDAEKNGKVTSFIEKEINLLLAGKGDKFAYRITKEKYDDLERTYYIKATCYLNKDDYMVGTWKTKFDLYNHYKTGQDYHKNQTEAFYLDGTSQVSTDPYRVPYSYSEKMLVYDGDICDPIIEQSKDRLVTKAVFPPKEGYKGGYTITVFTRIY